MNRREFLARLGRIAAAGALTAVGVKVGKKAADSGALLSCLNDGRCAPCWRSTSCGLPRALSFRQTRGTS